MRKLTCIDWLMCLFVFSLITFIEAKKKFLFTLNDTEIDKIHSHSFTLIDRPCSDLPNQFWVKFAKHSM